MIDRSTQTMFTSVMKDDLYKKSSQSISEISGDKKLHKYIGED